jgi:hypothetical protein
MKGEMIGAAGQARVAPIPDTAWVNQRETSSRWIDMTLLQAFGLVLVLAFALIGPIVYTICLLAFEAMRAKRKDRSTKQKAP